MSVRPTAVSCSEPRGCALQQTGACSYFSFGQEALSQLGQPAGTLWPVVFPVIVTHSYVYFPTTSILMRHLQFSDDLFSRIESSFIVFVHSDLQ